MTYARLQISRTAPWKPQEPQKPQEPPESRATDGLTGRPGFAGGYLLRRPDEAGAGALLTLWDTAEQARPAAPASAESGAGAGTVESDVIYEVAEEVTGPAAARPPRAAVVLHFDGWHSDEWLAAARFGHRERIAPAIRGVPGFVRALVLWDPGTRSSAVVSLALSVAALALMEKAVNTTELLPGEEPSLLPGPDRAVIHDVAWHAAGGAVGGAAGGVRPAAW